MDLLQQARAEIDAVDAEMAALFERRMQAVADVVRYKTETGKPVFDAAREADVITRNTARLQNEELRPYYKAFLQEAMAVSRAYQRATLGRDTAAYQGVEGAWSHIALRRMFPFARATAFATWPEVFDAVQNGDAQFGVLPFENSNAGDVSAVLDLLYTHPDIIVTHMQDMPIQQDLLGVKGAKLSNVRTVISHPQALAQSSVFLQQHGFTTESWLNTAGAAKHIAELNDPIMYFSTASFKKQAFFTNFTPKSFFLLFAQFFTFFIDTSSLIPPKAGRAAGSGSCVPAGRSVPV